MSVVSGQTEVGLNRKDGIENAEIERGIWTDVQYRRFVGQDRADDPDRRRANNRLDHPELRRYLLE